MEVDANGRKKKNNSHFQEVFKLVNFEVLKHLASTYLGHCRVHSVLHPVIIILEDPTKHIIDSCWLTYFS